MRAGRTLHPLPRPRRKPRRREEVRGARNWAKQAVAFSQRSRFLPWVRRALIDGAVGLALAPRGKLSRTLRFTFGCGNRTARIDIIGEPATLRTLDLSTLAE